MNSDIDLALQALSVTSDKDEGAAHGLREVASAVVLDYLIRSVTPEGQSVKHGLTKTYANCALCKTDFMPWRYSDTSIIFDNPRTKERVERAADISMCRDCNISLD